MSDNHPGVPLAHYLAHAGCWVRFHCLDCRMSRDFPVAEVIERLKKRGLGDERTGIRTVARFIERSCTRCHGFNFETTPGFTSVSR